MQKSKRILGALEKSPVIKESIWCKCDSLPPLVKEVDNSLKLTAV